MNAVTVAIVTTKGIIDDATVEEITIVDVDMKTMIDDPEDETNPPTKKTIPLAAEEIVPPQRPKPPPPTKINGKTNPGLETARTTAQEDLPPDLPHAPLLPPQNLAVVPAGTAQAHKPRRADPVLDLALRHHPEAVIEIDISLPIDQLRRLLFVRSRRLLKCNVSRDEIVLDGRNGGRGG